jgi:hypothetical protein
MIILGGLIFGGFMHLSNRENEQRAENSTEQTEVEKLLDHDMEQDYPLTAREVVKYYARIVKCIHSEEVSDDVVTKLGDTILLLYSAELIVANPREEYSKRLLAEVKQYQLDGKKVTSYAIDSADNTVTWTKDGVEFARILVTFTTQEDTVFNRTYEEFLLKKDSQNRWKILGWRLASKEDM